MRINKYCIYFFSLIILFMGITVKASCSDSEMSRLKELAMNIEFSSDYKLVNFSDADGMGTTANFSITAYNLNSEIRALIIDDYYTNNYREFKYNDNKTVVLDNFYGGNKVLVTFKALTTNDCSGKTVYTKTINLPYYNYFSTTDECKIYPDFKYCQTLLDGNVSNLKFYDELAKYKKALENKQDEPVVDDSKLDLNDIIILCSIILVVVLIIVIFVIRIVRERKKNKL